MNKREPKLPEKDCDSVFPLHLFHIRHQRSFDRNLAICAQCRRYFIIDNNGRVIKEISQTEFYKEVE